MADAMPPPELELSDELDEEDERRAALWEPSTFPSSPADAGAAAARTAVATSSEPTRAERIITSTRSCKGSAAT